jgi:Domain of unknown function (DUF4259)
MGAWGTDSFANDDALDWVAELEGAADLSIVRAALEEATSSEAEYVEAPVGSVALAAAEVVAALRGRPHPDLPEGVVAWVSAAGRSPDPALVALAARAVTAVADDPARSELRELWDEAAGEDRTAWQAGVAELRQRLA